MVIAYGYRFRLSGFEKQKNELGPNSKPLGRASVMITSSKFE